jgi:hypothetical protein
MGSGIICNTWQTCLRPVWARRGPCLHLADRLSRGKHLGISSIGVLIVSRGTKDKKPGKRRCVGIVCPEQIHSSPVTPACCLTRFLDPSSPPFSRLTAAFQRGISHSITTSKHHRSITAINLPSRVPAYYSNRRRRSSLLEQRTNTTEMCFHKYTHYLKCATHVPLHTHMCPKNATEDISRVIFCENYRAVRVNANEVCPFCSPADKGKGAGVARLAASTSQAAYPSPASTVTP